MPGSLDAAAQYCGALRPLRLLGFQLRKFRPSCAAILNQTAKSLTGKSFSMIPIKRSRVRGRSIWANEHDPMFRWRNATGRLKPPRLSLLRLPKERRVRRLDPSADGVQSTDFSRAFPLAN